MSEVKNITVTVIFSGAALNRDEKIGGNILSIKKLSIMEGPYAYISRQAIRHYLFNTLRKAFGDDWKDASVRIVRANNNQVIQFDLTKDDIISSAELDAFGYMFTISGERSLTRKAPVGITKAISLIPYNQDTSFGANHDLVRRAREQGEEANPNIYSSEENQTLFKVSFTIDAEFLGKDMWIVEEFSYKEDTKELYITIQKPQSAVLKNVAIETDEEGNEYYKVNDGRIYVEGNTLLVSKGLLQKAKSGKKSEGDQVALEFKSSLLKGGEGKDDEQDKNKKTKKGKGQNKNQNIKITEYTEEEDFYIFTVSKEPEYDPHSETLTISLGLQKVVRGVIKNKDNEFSFENNEGKIKVEKINSKYKVIFEVSEEIKKRRINQILEAIKNGLIAHSSGEDNTIMPVFLIAAPVRIPSPVFHPYLDVSIEGNEIRVIGLKDCVENSWLCDKVYIKDSEKIPVDKSSIKDRLYEKWEDFLKACGLEEKSEGEQKCPSSE